MAKRKLLTPEYNFPKEAYQRVEIEKEYVEPGGEFRSISAFSRAVPVTEAKFERCPDLLDPKEWIIERGNIRRVVQEKPMEAEEEEEEELSDEARFLSLSLHQQAERARKQATTAVQPPTETPEPSVRALVTPITLPEPHRLRPTEGDKKQIAEFCNILHPLAYPHLISLAHDIFGPLIGTPEKLPLCLALAEKLTIGEITPQSIKTLLDKLEDMEEEDRANLSKLDLNCPSEGCPPEWKLTPEDKKIPLFPLELYLDPILKQPVRDFVQLYEPPPSEEPKYYDWAMVKRFEGQDPTTKVSLDPEQVKVAPQADMMRQAFRQRWGEAWPLPEEIKAEEIKAIVEQKRGGYTYRTKIILECTSPLWWTTQKSLSFEIGTAGFEEVHEWIDFLDYELAKGNDEWPQTKIPDSISGTFPTDSFRFWNEGGIALSSHMRTQVALDYQAPVDEVKRTLIWDNIVFRASGKVILLIQDLDEAPAATNWIMKLNMRRVERGTSVESKTTVGNFISEVKRVMKQIPSVWEAMRNQRFNVEVLSVGTVTPDNLLFPRATKANYPFPAYSVLDFQKEWFVEDRTTTITFFFDSEGLYEMN